MQKDYSTFSIPSFARNEVEDFDDTSQECSEVYQELNAIAEEIERCRLRNS